MAKETIVGIDLGTCVSAVAVYNNGKPEIITNQEGSRTTPSVVSYQGEQISVGDTARRQQITNSERTIYAAKRFIGMKKADVEDEAKRVPYKVETGKDGAAVFSIDDKKVSPEQVGAQVLSKLKKAAEDFLGHEVKKAVITVPAYFSNSQRQATVDAGQIAGLEVLRVINEPTAAALAYGLDKKKDAKILILDCGGGTTDVSLLEIGDNIVEVVGTHGDVHLGGEDFDNRLIDYLAEEFKKSDGIDLRKDKLALQRLKVEAEKAKKELSSVAEVEVNIPFITADQNGPKHLQIKVSRAKFESLIGDLIDRVFACADKVLSDTKKTAADIDEVVFVGGSTRIPLIGERAKKVFGKEPNRSVNPDEAVALGAAVQAGMLAGEQSDLLLLDVTSLSLGIETLGGVFTTLIPRNTTIPTKKAEIFSTAADNQAAVTVRVAQGERKMFADNQLLATFNLDGIPPAPRGTPQIEVAFSIDANGIVSVSATDKATNKSKEITIKPGLSKEEIERMIKEAEQNEAADKKRAELAQKFNQLDGLILNTRKLFTDNADKLASLKDDADKALEAAQSVLDGRDEAKLDEQLKAIEAVAHKAAEILYKPQAEPVQAEAA